MSEPASPDPSAIPAAPPPAEPSAAESAARRDFLKRTLGVTLGGCALATSAVASAIVLFDPLMRKSGSGIVVRLATLPELPPGSPPRLYQVISQPVDAWTKYPSKAVGSVFLHRTDEKTVVAYNALCPHVGGPITYREGKRDYFCPLHDSAFALAGGGIVGAAASPRGMDSLDVELRGDEIWVHFQNFAPNSRDKKPV